MLIGQGNWQPLVLSAFVQGPRRLQSGNRKGRVLPVEFPNVGKSRGNAGGSMWMAAPKAVTSELLNALIFLRVKCEL